MFKTRTKYAGANETHTANDGEQNVQKMSHRTGWWDFRAEKQTKSMVSAARGAQERTRTSTAFTTGT